MDYANLQIAVSTKGVSQANRELDGLSSKGARAERSTDGLTNRFKLLTGGAIALAGAVVGLREITNVARRFDVLNAQLVTATGSAEGADRAFRAIQQFASTTPYDLEQATTAFTKLVNLGLDPSEEALRSYGNTAAAMGKDLNQLIEAVADASVGEFERLKEFGINARSEGENVSFTFRGVATTVRKESAAIEGYLRRLGHLV